MDIEVLKAELTDDPLGRGYSGMSDADAAADLNTVYRERDRIIMTGSEVLNAVDDGEWIALSDADKQIVWNIVHLGDVNPFGVEARLMLLVFSAPDSPTIAALVAARKEAVSRAVELGLGHVFSAHTKAARAYHAE